MAQATKLIDLPVAARTKPHAEPDHQPHAMQQPDGPRKLVRPQLPEHLAKPFPAPRRLRGAAPLAAHEGHPGASRGTASGAASHAEALYFQKQMQTQTPMVFVLEDGEQIEGIVEWFDTDSIKVRNHTRILIFKRSIKYLHKASSDSTL